MLVFGFEIISNLVWNYNPKKNKQRNIFLRSTKIRILNLQIYLLDFKNTHKFK